MKRHRVVLFATLLLDCAVIQADDSAAWTVRFKLYGHLIFIKGGVGAVNDLNFVVDTGTSTTTISRDLAKRLELTTEPHSVVSLGRRRQLEKARVPSLRFAGLDFRDLPVATASLSLAGRTPRIDALIGLDLLRRTNLSIDYKTQTMHFGVIGHSRSCIAFYDELPFVPVSVWINGRPVTLLLDTGAPALVLYQGAIDGHLDFGQTLETVPMSFLHGRTTVRRLDLDQVSMGSRRWKGVVGYLLRVEPPPGHPAGVLGVASLNLKRLVLDFDRNIMSWE